MAEDDEDDDDGETCCVDDEEDDDESLKQRDESSAVSAVSSASSSASACVWRTAIDKATGKPYYYDTVTRRTQWEKPDELRQYERRKKEERRRRDRKFFDEMEANVLKALARGEIIPGISREQTPVEGPPQEPLQDRKPRVRTISGMDDVLLAELRDDYHSVTTTRQVQQHRQVPAAAGVGVGEAPRHQQQRPSNTIVGRPPLPRPAFSSSLSKNHHVTFQPQNQTSTLLLPDTFKDEQGKHPFQNQQQHQQQSNPKIAGAQGSADHEIAGKGLVHALLQGKRGVNSTSRDLDPSSGRSLSPTSGGQQQQHIRRNTGGTIYLQNTMMNPDIQATIRCVCAIIRAHIIQHHNAAKAASSSPSSRPVPREYLVFKDDYSSQTPRTRKSPPVPSLDEVISFYEAFYKRSQMEHDTIITSLIYLERLIKQTNGALSPDPENWHSILFATMVLASKVWDDLSMWNVDFSNVSAHTHGLSSFTLRRINQLEIELLKILHFDVKVNASEYAKYYFLIRAMLLRSGLVKEEEKPLQKLGALERFDPVRFGETDPNAAQPRPKRDRAWQSMDATFSNALTIHAIGPVLQEQQCVEQLI